MRKKSTLTGAAQRAVDAVKPARATGEGTLPSPGGARNGARVGPARGGALPALGEESARDEGF